MAGTLEITDDTVWMPAGWVFDGVLERIARHVKGRDPSLTDELLKGRVEGGVGYLDLRRLSEAQFRAVVDAATMSLQELVSHGPSSFVKPSFYVGFLKHLAELTGLLQTDERATGRPLLET